MPMKSSILNTHSINKKSILELSAQTDIARLPGLSRINRDYPVESAHERSLFTSCNAS